MKIIVTGAGGFVGQLLVPELIANGLDLCLVGRSPNKLRETFPNVVCCHYDHLDEHGINADICVHLAAANSDSLLSESEFFAINVDFTMKVAKAVRSLGVKRFVNVSSVHALQGKNATPYARSKRAAAFALEELFGAWGQTVYLAAVYGDRWGGKLAILNSVPKPLARFLFAPLAALKPVVDIRQLTKFLMNLPQASTPQSASILTDDKSRNLFYTSTKRLIDLAFVSAVFILAGWLLIFVWIVVKITSPGPGIFAQERVGENGKTFTCYKLRTMQVNTKQTGTHEVSSASVTRVGAVLRKTKLDELPQILNILRNEMSLIGPRPCLPNQTELVAERQAQHILGIKPGISGLAQVNDIDMSTPRLLADWDARYCKLRSLNLDLSIIITTATGHGQGDKIKSEQR